MTQDDPAYPVQLYVYDLSRGMARQMSMALTGRQIDGIWHTSIVAWNREYFFGQGISVVHPGTSHHGAPLETYDLGTTAIDADTFEQLLLQDLKDRFRPEDYNLLSWNCNNFTQEVSQILTGNDIPEHIRRLPDDFLATPLGQMMRPQIEAMFRGPAQGPAASAFSPAAGPGAGLLNQVASRAYTGNEPMLSQNGNGTAAPAAASTSDPVRHVSSKAELDRLQQGYPCVAVLFTSESCSPCRIIKPVFTDLAHKYHVSESERGPHKRVAFVQVESSIVMQACGITATPTVLCYANTKLSGQVKGADVGELKTAIDLMLFEIYPPHPHTQIKRGLKSFRSIPRTAHTYRNIPNLRAALQKLDSFIADHPAQNFSEKADMQDARRLVASTFIPWLERTFDAKGQVTSGSKLDPLVIKAVDQAITTLTDRLPVTYIFPVVDMMRLAVLHDDFAAQLLSKGSEKSSSLSQILTRVQDLLSEGKWETTQRALYLTTARMLGNLSASAHLMEAIEYQNPLRQRVLELITSFLLSPDAGVRSAAATSSFNIALFEHEQRPDWLSRDPTAPPSVGSRLGDEWETEACSALLQAISDESDSDETLHRLAAALALTLHLSQYWEDQLSGLVEVLEASAVLRGKAAAEWLSQSNKRAELVALLEDLAELTHTKQG